MTRTGVLHISSGDSRVGNTLLARCGAQHPLDAATTFVRRRGLRDGDRIRVTGDAGSLNGVAVLCMTTAEAA